MVSSILAPMGAVVLSALNGGAAPAPTTPPAGTQLCNGGQDSAMLTGPPTAPTGAVTIPAGDNNPTYDQWYSLTPFTIYYLATGVHTLGTSPNATFVPQEGDAFIGAPGAIIDGQHHNQWAFDGVASNVTIEYLTIRNFVPPGEGQSVVNHDDGADWSVEYNTIGPNLGAGVGVGSEDFVSENCLTHNDQYGFDAADHSAAISDATVTSNEISYNDVNGTYDQAAFTASYSVSGYVATITTESPLSLQAGFPILVGDVTGCSFTWCANLSDPALDGAWSVASVLSPTSFTVDVPTPDVALTADTTGTIADPSVTCRCSGGGKLSNTRGSTVSDNYVHDNGYLGIWAQLDNAGTDITGNYIARNWAEGVTYETSYNASITDNAFIDNAWGQGPSPALEGFPDSALYISESGSDSRVPGNYGTSLEIAANVFTDNWGGVVVYENAGRACGSSDDALCTLVDPAVYTLSSCAAGLVNGLTTAVPDYVDNCRWKSQNVAVTGNTFNFTPSNIGLDCTPADYCGFNGLFSVPGTPPTSTLLGPWPAGATYPYAGYVVPNDVSNKQNDSFADNRYCASGGSWEFVGFVQGNSMTPTAWMAGETNVAGSGDNFTGQDAGSTFAASGCLPTGSSPPPTTSPTVPTPSSTVPTTSSTVPPERTCSGTAVVPTDNVQALINAAPAATTFCFGPGTYDVSSLAPKSGDTFDGDNQQAVLNGGNVRQHAIVDNATSNVTVENFVIEDYATPLQQGAIEAFGGTGWTIEGNHITHNAASGVTTGSDVRVLDNTIDYNTQEGFGAQGSGGLYEGNDIAFNNYALTVDATWEAGGGKCWATTGLTIAGNYVHDNGGNGIWCDTNNIDTTIENNTVSNNWGAGIYEEISYNASITGNVVEHNGMPSSPGGGQKLGYLWDAGIQLRGSGSTSATSPFVISGNWVLDNYNGITLIQSPNGTYGACNTEYTAGKEGLYGPCLVQNVLVENNTISMTQGATGAAQDGAGPGIFTTQNNHFVGNHYTVAASNPASYASGWLAWDNGWPTWAAWKLLGNDLTGDLVS